MTNLFIYIDGVREKFDLFDDEKISITSSIQNFSDISKTFTDYSKTFNIPPTSNNNRILKHWYDNTIENGYDHRLRYDGVIEIDTELFRRGKWQIENATIKGNVIENYKMTFYGALKSLTDKFGDEKLKDVTEINDYTITYDEDEVISRVETDANYDLSFPLITSGKVWSYGDATATDISTSTGAIVYNELHPALRVSKIFDAIADRYGVTFDGDILTESRFTELFLYLKNKENFILYTEVLPIDFTSTTNETAYFLGSTTTDSIECKRKITPPYEKAAKLSIEVTTLGTWILYVYKNGIEIAKINGSGTETKVIFEETLYNAGANIGVYTFALQMESAASFTTSVIGQYKVFGVEHDLEMESDPQTPAVSFNLTSYCPDIKVSDFVSGIMKMFNLVAFSYETDIYTLEQLETWYESGEFKDFTKYTTTDADIDRIKSYKKIDFKYQKSESILNKAFFDLFGREYGDLNYSFTNDGTDYTIQLPFENLLHQKFTGTDLQVGYCLKSDLAPYIPKPILLYRYGNLTCDIVMNNGTTDVAVTTYNAFGQDCIDTTLQTINWGLENSSLLGGTVPSTLFSNYYLAYLNNIYSIKSRMIKVKMLLPYRELTNLKLNDRIIIRENRYIINSFTTDLTTFEVDFELIHDFRAVESINFSQYTIDYQAGSYAFDITDDGSTWSVQSDVDDMIVSVSASGDELTIVVLENESTALKSAVLISSSGDIINITQGYQVEEVNLSLQIAATGGSLTTCCAQDDYLELFYSRDPLPIVNDIFYVDNALALPYNGGRMYHKEDVTGAAYKIGFDGKITEIINNNC